MPSVRQSRWNAASASSSVHGRRSLGRCPAGTHARARRPDSGPAEIERVKDLPSSSASSDERAPADAGGRRRATRRRQPDADQPHPRRAGSRRTSQSRSSRRRLHAITARASAPAVSIYSRARGRSRAAAHARPRYGAGRRTTDQIVESTLAIQSRIASLAFPSTPGCRGRRGAPGAQQPQASTWLGAACPRCPCRDVSSPNRAQTVAVATLVLSRSVRRRSAACRACGDHRLAEALFTQARVWSRFALQVDAAVGREPLCAQARGAASVRQQPVQLGAEAVVVAQARPRGGQLVERRIARHVAAAVVPNSVLALIRVTLSPRRKRASWCGRPGPTRSSARSPRPMVAPLRSPHRRLRARARLRASPGRADCARSRCVGSASDHGRSITVPTSAPL